MSSLRNKAELEIDQDIQQQQRVWVIERVSWLIMGLFLLAAMLGLFGHGLLSSSRIDDPASGMLIQYERFERMNAQTLFRIRLQPQASQDSRARLSLGDEFLRKVEIIRIEPEPAEVEAWADHVTYVITHPDPGDAAEISIYYKPLDFGGVRVEVGREGYPLQAFSQFVYP